MLNDFIEANNIPAVIEPKRITVNLAECVLLMPLDEKEMPVMAIVPVEKKLGLQKAGKAAKSGELRFAGGLETVKITGYKPGFVPPVSVYGVIVLLERSLAEKRAVGFRVTDEKTLRIDPRIILSENEGAKASDLVE